MELCDLLFVLLRNKFMDANLNGKDIIVDYIYNRKVVDAGTDHWVLLYQVFEQSRWYDLGAGKWYKIERVSVDVRTMDKDAYWYIKNGLFELFDGSVYVFKKGSAYDSVLEYGVSVTAINDVGIYTKDLTVADPTIYSVGDYVQVIDENANTFDAWIVDIYGNEVTIFMREGEYFLIQPSSVNDFSDRMRNLFRFVVEVEGKATIPRI